MKKINKKEKNIELFPIGVASIIGLFDNEKPKPKKLTEKQRRKLLPQYKNEPNNRFFY